MTRGLFELMFFVLFCFDEDGREDGPVTSELPKIQQSLKNTVTHPIYLSFSQTPISRQHNFAFHAPRSSWDNRKRWNFPTE